MTNIYDIIHDLYADDGGWDLILEQKYAEQFLRKEAFRGASDDELVDIWQQVMYLLIYCGNASCKIGDITGEDLIDCISWCQRNIGDFELNFDSVEYFLSVIDRLLNFLKQKREISSAEAAAKCKLRLLGPNKKLNLFRENGSLPESYEKFRTNRGPDLETKAFMQLGQKLFDLFSMMQKYFSGDSYIYERKRACYAFFGSDVEPDEKARPDLYYSFWEFFILDFHMSEAGMRPISVFYDYYREHPDPAFSKSNKALIALLETLINVRLMLFTVEGECVDGWYPCRDFFTGSISQLALPVDDASDLFHMVCMGHVFEDGNLVTDYVRSVYVTPVAQKALYNRFCSLLEWYRIRNPQADWEDFCGDNPALVAHMVAMAGMQNTVQGSFRWKTEIHDYKPELLDRKNNVLLLLFRFGRLMHIAWQDRRNLMQIWSDFTAVNPVVCIVYDDFIIWALAVMQNYIEISRIELLDIRAYAASLNLDQSRIDERAKIIRETLKLEPFDPRYNSEEVFMNMIFS